MPKSFPVAVSVDLLLDVFFKSVSLGDEMVLHRVLAKSAVKYNLCRHSIFKVQYHTVKSGTVKASRGNLLEERFIKQARTRRMYLNVLFESTKIPHKSG
jgi:hypothetical protein